MSEYEVYYSVNGRYGRLRISANSSYDAEQIVRGSFPGAVVHSVKKLRGP